MAAGDIWEASFQYQNAGGQFANVLHMESDVEVSPTLESFGTAMAAGFAAGIAASFMPCCSDETTLVCAHVRRVAPTGSRVFASYVDSGTAGGFAFPAVSAQVAAVISKYTAVNDKTGRGRIYVAGIPESEVTLGAIETGLGSLESVLQQFADVFLLGGWQDPTGNEFTPVLWSRKLDTAQPITATVIRPVTGIIRGRRSPNRPFA